VLVKYIVQDNTGKLVQADSVSIPEKKNLTLHVATDIPGKTFPVVLKDQLQNEKPESPYVNKMLVISDIEGNFAAFRKLLQGNGVIDENFNWTFGNGQLVLTGDFPFALYSAQTNAEGKIMEYRKLGTSGLKVSAISLGACFNHKHVVDR